MSWQARNLESEPWLPAQALSPATQLCRSPLAADGGRSPRPCLALPSWPASLAHSGTARDNGGKVPREE